MDDGDLLLAAWPIAGLRVRTPRLELRSATDDDLVELAARTDDVHDPGFQPFMTGWALRPSPERERGLLQYHWRARAGLGAEDWSLPLAVVVDGAVVGTQDIGAGDFAIRRTVSTGSWLHRPLHGRGLGTEMRAAVLHLAFAGLGAERAETGAFAGNSSSLRVTEKLGYRPNGDEVHVIDGERRLEHRFVLDRATWERTRRDDIDLVGVDPCRPLLGA
jgi:RimJ/RimL family protein N-acetyltransferase